jgi:molybdenum cofactor biosynthesis protein A
MMPQLIDSHGRILNYLRFSVIDKCNLRCRYCMPADGIDWIKQDELATTDECLRMLEIFHRCGITKVRFTGGEPFIRKDFQEILLRISREKWFEQIQITTNGTLGAEVISSLPRGLINGINLSLDSLQRESYRAITRRDALPEVMRFFHLLQSLEIPTKINMVVIAGMNDHEILDMALWAKDHPIEVRFIEEMPFNGTGLYSPTLWDFIKIKETLLAKFPHMRELPFGTGDTAQRYQVEGFKGVFGIIAAWSRNFCGQCNRIRLTATGQIRTCLYAHSGYSMLAGIRSGKSDEDLIQMLQTVVMKKAKDGVVAEQNESQHPSMAHIGG